MTTRATIPGKSQGTVRILIASRPERSCATSRWERFAR